MQLYANINSRNIVTLLILSIIMYLSSSYEIKIINNDKEVVKYGTLYLKIASFILPVYPFFFISNALFQGLKKAVIVMYVSLLRFVFFPLIGIITLSFFLKLQFEIIFLFLMVINWVICLIYFIYSLNKIKKLTNNTI